uniref:ATP synthase complex subunit 8 n=1 Tax=Plateumaris sericea TaxID=225723 RepID=A0A3G1GSX8_PLASE|nr:ATP synthase F0 subunit 8 [Plateumaris sericea]
MPQMSPLNWMMLFIYFLLIFMIFNIMNYYKTKMFNKKINIIKYPMKINWKW